MNTFGITGGIGMGKSTSAAILTRMGYPVVDTDALAREVVQPGEPALDEIVGLFGRDILDPSGRLRRQELGRIVFRDAALRAKLESILHPRIRQGWKAKLEEWRSSQQSLAAVVIPLLFETHAEDGFDHVVCVACSAATQHERLLARGWDPAQIAERVAAQWPTETKLLRADYVVWTEGAIAQHEEQLRRLFASASPPAT